MSLVLPIASISIVGIILIYVLINTILRKIIYIPHIPNTKTPNDFSITFDEHFLKTESTKKIQLWDLNPNSEKTIILAVHGWSRSADSLLPLLAGINNEAHVFVLNTRNHGKSDSEKDLSIAKYKDDIKIAIEFIKNKNKNEDIILLGHSFGAATVLEMGHLDNSVSGLILLSLFADGEKLIRRQFEQKKIPKQLIDSLVKSIEFKNGEKLSRVAPKDIIGQVKIPILMIHGKKDKSVSENDFNDLKMQLNEDSKAIILEHEDHVSVLDNNKASSEISIFIKDQFESEFIFNPAFLKKVD
ncbi:MAG: alpha/beta fold hydrolase [Calditrichaeota bacterium]|nr:alpha/beta fold hydrolase [Calditrichota bacterium]